MEKEKINFQRGKNLKQTLKIGEWKRELITRELPLIIAGLIELGCDPKEMYLDYLMDEPPPEKANILIGSYDEEEDRILISHAYETDEGCIGVGMHEWLVKEKRFKDYSKIASKVGSNIDPDKPDITTDIKGDNLF